MSEQNSKPAKAAITFLGNFYFDTRVFNLYHSLKSKGFVVEVFSFDWLTKDYIAPASDAIRIYKLNKKNSSLLFYLNFARLLLFNLLRQNYDIIIAGDFYTMPFALLVGKLKGIPVVYDSREVYSELAGLKDKPALQNLITAIERFCIKKVSLICTSGHLDSEFIEAKYKLQDTFVLRNLPLLQKTVNPVDLRKLYNIPVYAKILLYQGVILHGRGLKLVIPLMDYLPDYYLIIIGGGEQELHFRALAKESQASDRIIFHGKVTQEELLQHTAAADAGLALIENLSVSYYYALPNKLFEYIQAGVPVIVSNFPQMQEIIDTFRVGVSVDPEKPEQIIQALKKLFENSSEYNKLKEQCKAAAKILCWENEFEKLFPRISKLLRIKAGA